MLVTVLTVRVGEHNFNYYYYYYLDTFILIHTGATTKINLTAKFVASA